MPWTKIGSLIVTFLMAITRLSGSEINDAVD